MENIFLETERLLLKKVSSEDYDDIAEIIQDKEVMKAWEHEFKDEDVLEWIKTCKKGYKEHNLGYFLAIDKTSKSAIGQIGLMQDTIYGKTYLEVAYILHKRFWGRGYAKEGARAMIDYGIHELKEEQILAEIRPDNANSRRLAKSLGLKLVDSFIKYNRGKRLFHLIYSTQDEELERKDLMNDQQIEEIIINNEYLLRKAMIEDDIELLEFLLADDLKFMTPDNKMINKQDDLSAHNSGIQRLDSIEFINQTVNIVDSSTIETISKVQLKGSVQGFDLSGRYVYKRIWTLIGGRYQVTEGSCALAS